MRRPERGGARNSVGHYHIITILIAKSRTHTPKVRAWGLWFMPVLSPSQLGRATTLLWTCSITLGRHRHHHTATKASTAAIVILSSLSRMCRQSGCRGGRRVVCASVDVCAGASRCEAASVQALWCASCIFSIPIQLYNHKISARSTRHCARATCVRQNDNRPCCLCLVHLQDLLRLLLIQIARRSDARPRAYRK